MNLNRFSFNYISFNNDSEKNINQSYEFSDIH